MLELCQSFGSVAWHGEVVLLPGAIPVNLDADVFLTSPVCFDIVLSVDCVNGIDCVNKVLRTLLSNVLDPKVADHKCELNWVPLVFPQARDKPALIVVLFVEALFFSNS